MPCLLSYNISLTGDCSNTNSGEFSIDIFGSAPDYTIEWISPITDTIPLGPGVVNYSYSSLSAGTYTLQIIDSCAPSNTVETVNIYISSGTCVTISGDEDTSCGLNNGSITATTSNLYGIATFELYEQSSGFISSGQTASNSFVFDGLTSGFYYVIANDGGGCTGRTETCLVKPSTPLNFGFYIINTSPCVGSTGSIYITGLTGNAPYTYSWSNGGTNSFITGLTEGSYNVVVTDSLGCVTSLGTVISSVPELDIASIITTSPSCYSNDGSATVTIVGGSAPFYFSGSNGYTLITYSNVVTFTGLTSGSFSVFVQDAGLCTDLISTILLTPSSFVITSVNTTNSTCNNNSGQLSVTIFGGSPPYTYTLTDSLSNSTIVSGNFTTYTFDGLSTGTYTLTISDLGPCEFVDNYDINNTVLFELSTSTTGTTCNQENGSVTLTITTGGTGPYTFQINGQSIITNDLSYTFTNLSSGSYTATVTDSTSCSQIQLFNIPSSPTVDFILVGNNSTNGSNGSVEALIIDGTPPFTWIWSPNVNGQTGLTVTNLSADTYTLTVTDDNGCVRTRNVTIEGFNKLESYQLFTICDDEFLNTGDLGLKGPQQFLIEGFYDLTENNTNCIINQTIFELITEVGEETKSKDFYTGNTINEFPTNQLYADTLEELLLSYPTIGEVIIDLLENKTIIITNCNVSENINGTKVKIYLRITYDISCVSCD